LIAHQRKVRLKKEQELRPNLFPLDFKTLNLNLEDTKIEKISYRTAKPIVKEYEWIGTMPLPKACRFIYGIYFDGILGGVVVYVEPSTRQFNKSLPRQVVQLNRGCCTYWTPSNTATFFISRTLKLLKVEGILLVLAYCTKEAGEIGTIYQASNFLYVGRTAPSTIYFLDNHWISQRTLADKIKWSKGRNEKWFNLFNNLPSQRIEGKYKYIKLLGTHKCNKQILKQFNFMVYPYPKRAEEVSKEKHQVANLEGVGQYHDSAPIFKETK
jgi:hypothetical protein